MRTQFRVQEPIRFGFTIIELLLGLFESRFRECEVKNTAVGPCVSS
jgi:hypothetical protein